MPSKATIHFQINPYPSPSRIYSEVHSSHTNPLYRRDTGQNRISPDQDKGNKLHKKILGPRKFQKDLASTWGSTRNCMRE